MFFKSVKSNSIYLKIAPYIKIPFADNKLSVPGHACEHYNNIYNLVQSVRGNDYLTYFYTKNNLAYYYRKQRYENCFIIPDLLKGNYEVVDVKKLNYRIEGTKNIKPKTLLIKTADGMFYIISDNVIGDEGEKFVMILNLSNKQMLYKKSQNDNIYINWFYPIANVIVPILRVTSEGLYFDLVNLLNGRTNTIGCDLYCVSQMIKELINKSKNSNSDLIDTAKNISHFYFKSVSYEYQIYKDNISYAKSISVEFAFGVYGQAYSYSVYNAFLVIELADKAISLYFSFNNSHIGIYKSGKPIKYLDGLNNRFMLQRHHFDSKIKNIKLHDQLYVDDCYQIYQDEDGFKIAGRNKHLGGYDIKASVYSYRHYKIFVFSLSDERKRYDVPSWQEWTGDGIAIIDTKHRKTLVWTYKSHMDGHCLQYPSIGHYYYSSKSQKLIFLSSNSSCFSVINARKIDKAFDLFFKQQQLGCQEQSNIIANELAESYDVIPMVIDEVARRYKIPSAFMSYSEIKIMSNYIDKNSDILYIAANYKINNFESDYYTEYIGLFMWPIYEDNVKLKLLWYKEADSKLLCHKPLKLQYPTIYKESMPNILKLDLKNRDATLIDLYLAYDIYRHIFIDMKNNRSSARMGKIYDKFVSNNHLISKFDNLLFINYGKINEYSLMDILGKLCFIISDAAMMVKEFPLYYV
jgi:hypothetical protein